MKINNLDTSKKIFIVAEIGNNHEGNFEIAKKMIEKAAEAGVDAVKFQTFIPEYISGGDEKRLKRLQSYKFTHEQFHKLAKIAKKYKLIFFSTPFDIQSAIFLNTIQPVFKIASGDNNFYPLINKVINFGKPLIISTGGSNIISIKKLYKYICKIMKKKKLEKNLAFMHCVSSYPVPQNQANLASIKYLKSIFSDIEIGYSDHTLGIEASIYSVFTGARIIEKHFTLDKNYSNFRDHKLSADPRELKLLVKQIRNAEEIYGLEEKKIQKCEKDLNHYGRRSIAVNRNLASGKKLKLSDLTWIRPGTGLPPGEEKQVLNKKLRCSLKYNQIVNEKDFL
jgi:N,N'-diacetyllegionaminate synthase